MFLAKVVLPDCLSPVMDTIGDRSKPLLIWFSLSVSLITIP